MKKSSLTTAVLAGLAGVVGFAGSAGAVNLNPDGTGQVLIYPYYTVNAGQQTSISVVNSTEAGKAVKVRFIEGYNSREVLDFNLFLSPYDVWTGTIFAMDDAGLGSEGGAFGTADKSCTVPSFATLPVVGNGLHYQPFSSQEFTGSRVDTGPTDITRTREGYVELIQMADVIGDSLDAITHIAGVPDDCGASSLRSDNSDFVSPTGGLFGNGYIINVSEGTLYPYVADAIDGFSDRPLFSPSGSLNPSLKDARTAPGIATAYVFQKTGSGVTVLNATYNAPDTIDAVSAVFAAKSLMNEWIANADAGQGTDWVITFPTKRFYVDPTASTSPTVIPPFAYTFGEKDNSTNPPKNGPGQSCVQVGINMYDREESSPADGGGGDIFSPPPKDQPPSSLCHEVNVISISDPSAPVSILGSDLALNINPHGTSGWLNLDLNPDPVGEPHAMRPSATDAYVFTGLPATGFAAQRFVNASAQPGKLASYAGAFHHRVERNCSMAATGGGDPVPCE